jgi:hypothetical protein
MNRPEIVSVGIVWDSDRPTLDHIMALLSTLRTSLRLCDVFHGSFDLPNGSMPLQHQLVGVVTYYGKHYSTFFYHTKLKIWIYFDDANVREIGPRWEQVKSIIIRKIFIILLSVLLNTNLLYLFYYSGSREM